MREGDWGAAGLGLLAVVSVLLAPSTVAADGKVMPPAEYQGSLEERAQEAILIFHGSGEPGGATEDLILRIEVEGEADEFAWVIPFPAEPTIAKEESRLFRELFDYVAARQASQRKAHGNKTAAVTGEAEDREPPGVTVLQQKVVGSYQTAVVKENEAGALNEWLEQEGYQTLTGDDADEVLAFYREKGYIYACVKVSDAELKKDEPADLHPLRFSFKTGGRDGMFFPMKLTGLQSQPFDVNLYVFYNKWVNDDVSKFGYVHRGFRLKYRDWDSPDCERNAGKTYSTPEGDVFLQGYARRLATVAKLFQKLHPGERYYLTNIQARGLQPDDVRNWSDDLWLFPYYTDPDAVPYDVLPGEPASAAWPDVQLSSPGSAGSAGGGTWSLWGVGIGAGLLAVAVVIGLAVFRRAGGSP